MIERGKQNVESSDYWTKEVFCKRVKFCIPIPDHIPREQWAKYVDAIREKKNYD